MKTFKKLFSVSAIVALLGTLAPMYAFGADYSAELVQAYDYAHGHGITTMSSIDNADMYGNLTRIAMAKMLANYAVDVLGLTPDTTKDCTFPDVSAALDEQYGNGVTKACQLGLMGVGIEKFNPNGLVTRAEFGTAFSRALNGGDAEKLAEMNKADPYYKEHLNFLKDEGIMTKIDTPSQLEVRGYVMLMMMRSDDSYTPTEGCTAEELLKCLTADDYDACIATCSNENNNEEDLVHKSGTLNVSAVANNGVKAVIDGVSELDTIKLNASEAINVEKVTLERYGYTKNVGVKVWLENTDGVVISNEKELTPTKDDIALTIKKDFRDATSTKEYVVVTEIIGGTCSIAAGNADQATCEALLPTAGVWTVNHTAGETIGFKVTDVVSSAETLKIAAYTPTEYTLAVNNSSTITATLKGKTMIYNYAEGESYQVAKVRVQAASAEISVNGLTIRTDTTAGHDLDLKRFVDKVEVLGDDGIALKLSATDIKTDSIKVTFPAQTIAAKKNADFTILLKLKDFDMFGQKAVFTMTNSDIAAVETKTSTRVNANVTLPATLYAYTFQGSKIKVTSKNLGNVSAAKGANDVVVAEGTIEVSEAVELNSFDIVATVANQIESLELWLNGSLVEEATLQADKKTFKFPKTLIEKSGKLQFVADIDDNAAGTLTFNTFKESVLDPTSAGTVGTYDASGKPVASANFAGSISFSTIKIETAKGNLENNISKKVEVITDSQVAKKVLFDGTYTASKGDVYLNELTITESSATPLAADESITFYVYINGEAVADTMITSTTALATTNETFGDVLVKKGEKATIKVEAEVEANTAKAADLVYVLQLDGEDVDGNPITPSATENMTNVAFVSAGSATVVATTSNDVMLRGSNVSLAKFTVKSNLEGTRLVSFVIDGLQTPAGTSFAATDVKVIVDGTTLDATASDYSITAGKLTIAANVIDEAVDTDGVDVEVVYKGELADGQYDIVLKTVNTSNINKTFTKYVVPALVKITAQENLGDTTKFTFSVEKADESYDVSALKLYVNGVPETIGTVTDGQIEELNNSTSSAQFIDRIDYTVSTATPFNAQIKKADYKDFFRIGTSFLKVFKAQD